MNPQRALSRALTFQDHVASVRLSRRESEFANDVFERYDRDDSDINVYRLSELERRFLKP